MEKKWKLRTRLCAPSVHARPERLMGRQVEFLVRVLAARKTGLRIQPDFVDGQHHGSVIVTGHDNSRAMISSIVMNISSTLFKRFPISSMAYFKSYNTIKHSTPTSCVLHT